MSTAVLLVVAVMAVSTTIYFARHRDSLGRARFLRQVGFAVTAVFGGFFGLLLAGETISDPGGLESVGLIAAWAIPLTVLLLLTWRRQIWAGRVLFFLVCLYVAINLWFRADSSSWRALENNVGPVRAIYLFVLGTALAAYGLRRTLPAGLMLLVAGIAPTALAYQSRPGFSSLALAGAAPLITGALYLTSAAITNTIHTSAHKGTQQP
ncbi:MAG: hypothetical protein M0Z96_02110 [Actinomycetota bacterium]|nr:hypothetical protein [Actinomycetota bacterium]